MARGTVTVLKDAPAPRPEAEGGVLEVRVDVGDDGLRVRYAMGK